MGGAYLDDMPTVLPAGMVGTYLEALERRAAAIHIKPLRPQTEKSCYTTCTNPNVDYDGSVDSYDEAELNAVYGSTYKGPCKCPETV